MRHVIFCCDETAARFLVESMNDPRTLLSADTREILAMAEQGVDQRMLRVARAGMHDQSSRLIQNEQIVILKQNLQRHLLRLCFDFFDGRFRQLDDIPRPDKIAGAGCFSVQRDESSPDQSLKARARKVREFAGEKAVQPQTGAFARYLERDHAEAQKGQSGLKEAFGTNTPRHCRRNELAEFLAGAIHAPKTNTRISD